MDRIRLTGFVIRQACDRLELEINQVLAADIVEPAQQRATLERVTALHHQTAVWLEIAAGRVPASAAPRPDRDDRMPFRCPGSVPQPPTIAPLSPHDL